ncbi:MAG: FlgB family protein [Roseovarius sp.]
MFEDLAIVRMAQALARHAGARQAIIARNVANADTPGYAARDIAPFAAIYGDGQAGLVPRATRPTHLRPDPDAQLLAPRVRAGAVADPNGNSVSLETEMVFAADTMRAHEQALAIYRHSLSVLRSALGRR